MPLKLVAEIKVTDVHAIRVFTDIERIKKGVSQLSRTGVDRAIVRATNKSLLKTRTMARKEFSKRFNLPLRTVVNKQILSFNASKTRKEAVISARGSRIPIIKVVGGAKQFKLGVKAKTGRGGKRLIRGAFIATMRSGHTGVYKRVLGMPARRVTYKSPTTGRLNTSALPVRELMFPPLASMLVRPEIANPLFKFFTRDYPLQLRRQLNAEFDKAGGLRSG